MPTTHEGEDTIRSSASQECPKPETSPDLAQSAASSDGRQKATVAKSPSGSATSGGAVEGYEAVFVKDNVSVHPSSLASERIAGRLRLVKQGPSLFMTWIPYSMASLADADRNLYSIRAVSVSEMRSIRRHTPALGWHYIIIVLTSGLAFPPLYFHNGGVREFLNTLKEHAQLIRSADDANVYLVNDAHDPLQRSLSLLDIAEAVPGTPIVELPNATPIVDPSPGSGSASNTVVLAPGDGAATQSDPAAPSRASSSGIEGSSNFFSRQRSQGLPDGAARDLSLQILEKFSMVTRFARTTGAQLFRGGDLSLLANGDGADRLPVPDEGPQRDGPAAGAESTPPFPALPPLQQGQNGGPLSTSDVVSAAAPKSDEPSADTTVGSFELVDGSQMESQALVYARARPPPLGPEEWATFLDGNGRVLDPKALQKRVFHGGLEPSMRKEVWKFLLGFYPFDSTAAERRALLEAKAEEYRVLKSQWESVTPDQARRFAKFRERCSRVDKDVVRTDRSLPFYADDDSINIELLRNILITYSFYNFDLGYCQGMSDLLSPVLYIMGEEAEAFWCFAALMERLAPNFDRDQNGMHSQLLALRKLVQLLDWPLHEYLKSVDGLNYFFCFRWVLIQFKREFQYEDVLRLWEVLWTRHLSDHFHLYICVALLKRHRRSIMDEQMDFDTLLRFTNELSGKIDLDATLRDAEALCRFAGGRGAACMPSTAPPEQIILDEM